MSNLHPLKPNHVQKTGTWRQKRKEKLSLVEQVAELSNPLPDDFEDEVNIAKICEDVNDTDGQRSLSAMTLDEDDMRYEGRPISRHHLEQEWGIVSGKLTFSFIFLNLTKLALYMY